jgi:hypothetical protein
MSMKNVCSEFEEVMEQISKIIDDAVKRLYEARDRLAKIIAIDARLIEGETDKYGVLVTYLDLLNLIQALTSGEITITFDIYRVLDNLGCRKEEKKDKKEKGEG